MKLRPLLVEALPFSTLHSALRFLKEATGGATPRAGALLQVKLRSGGPEQGTLLGWGLGGCPLSSHRRAPILPHSNLTSGQVGQAEDEGWPNLLLIPTPVIPWEVEALGESYHGFTRFMGCPRTAGDGGYPLPLQVPLMVLPRGT